MPRFEQSATRYGSSRSCSISFHVGTVFKEFNGNSGSNKNAPRSLGPISLGPDAAPFVIVPPCCAATGRTGTKVMVNARTAAKPWRVSFRYISSPAALGSRSTPGRSGFKDRQRGSRGPRTERPRDATYAWASRIRDQEQDPHLISSAPRLEVNAKRPRSVGVQVWGSYECLPPGSGGMVPGEDVPRRFRAPKPKNHSCWLPVLLLLASQSRPVRCRLSSVITTIHPNSHAETELLCWSELAF